ncbi:hypothetical protein [Laspinema olomoucense]|uniref:Uncharacterized protein n=1 Tax=Laspinema olomoucense D3b TaxID=2953688 RepID=A0ABT2NDU2_9CYAN|nr:MULTISPECIES: hypothetical protein [unclassified Laspinema]MCT7980054.1 hypothetical protein [Laspinema sp. D3b]MCT7995346.1 hypothetical protein [Laspinema sp. D3c]
MVAASLNSSSAVNKSACRVRERSIEINPLQTSHCQGLGGKIDRWDDPPSLGNWRGLWGGIETAIAVSIRAQLSYPAIARDSRHGILTSIWRMETG